MENKKNRNSGSNNEPEYGSRHSRNRSADASGNSAHGARGAAGTRARKVPHGVESDGLDTRAAAPARGISHEEKRRRQNRRDIFSSLGILLLIALLGFCGYTAYRFTCVDSFIVSGSGQYSAEQIIGLAGLQTGRHILSYNTDEISKNVSSIPNLICTGVRRVFPNKISINVADHNAAAAIPAANGTYTLVDAEGLVLAIGAESSGELILLRGMANIGFVRNTVITEKNHCLRTVTAMKLLAEGTDNSRGLGELVAVDVGGATTDVYSVANGMPTDPRTMLKGLPEPYIKRTVEGDIGMRYSIRGIVDAAGIKTIAELAGMSEARAEEIISMFAANTDLLPTDDETERLDEALACMAVRTAVTRHAGRIEEAYSMMGTTYVQTGKDLRKVQKLVVTGGSLIHTTNTAKIASFALYDQKEPTSLRPLRADVLVDRKYIIAAMGLLSEKYPEQALSIMKQELCRA